MVKKVFYVTFDWSGGICEHVYVTAMNKAEARKIVRGHYGAGVVIRTIELESFI